MEALSAGRGGVTDRFGRPAGAAVQSSSAMDPLVTKLRPSRSPGMSPFMAPMVGEEDAETGGHGDLGRGAVGFDGIDGLEDVRNNWNRLMDAAGLTP